jgi:RNA polymerase sigma-70 factor (ECF subfamily)
VPFEDAEIVAQVRGGQTAGFAKLVVKYQDRIFNTCWRICGHAEEARDLTQDAFVKALEGIHGFREESGFYTWLFRVAVNLSLSHRRKARTRKAVSLSAGDGAEGTQAEALSRRMQDVRAAAPDAAIGQAELSAKLVEALSGLDDDHRTVVILRDMEGFDYATIGEILNLAPGTVKSRLHRARTELRTAMAPWMKGG